MLYLMMIGYLKFLKIPPKYKSIQKSDRDLIKKYFITELNNKFLHILLKTL